MSDQALAGDERIAQPARVEYDERPEFCPSCGKLTRKHTAIQAFLCNDSDGPDLEEERPRRPRLPEPVVHDPVPERLLGRKNDAASAPAPAPAVAEPNVPSTVDEDLLDLNEIADFAFGEMPEPEPRMVKLGNGEIDYEELAAAMRRVIEKERDEVIKRGGPLEKQNAALKGRIADLLEECDRLRKRAHAATTRANSLQEQIDIAVKEKRKQRNAERKAKESGNHTRIVELKQLLDVVRKAPGWTVTMGGNGHYQIKKDGVFVTDAASSGGSTKVNMATRVNLRKAGLDV